MLFGSKIEHCPFIPFVIPNPKSADYQQISKILESEDQKPHLIFLANATFEEPPYTKALITHVLYFRNFKEPNSTYYDFLDLCFEIISSSTSKKIPYIGVASRTSPDFCEFFIARWLFNECGYTMSDAIKLVGESLQPGITKGKYLKQLSKLEEISEIESPFISEKSKPAAIETAPVQEEAIPDIHGKPEGSYGSESANPSESLQETKSDQISSEKVSNFSEISGQEPQPAKTDNSPKAISDIYHQQQLQLHLQELQAQEREIYKYHEQINQRLLDFQSHPYEYRQQNIKYQLQLKSNLNEAIIRMRQVGIQKQQVQQQLLQPPQPPATQISETKVDEMAKPPQETATADDYSMDAEEIRVKTEKTAEKTEAQNLLQPQMIEQQVPTQHASMYSDEITKMMNIPIEKRLFTKFLPITVPQLENLRERLEKDPQTKYCLMPEPQGIRALLYLRGKIPILIFKNYSPIQLKIDIENNDDDLYIFEVIFVRYSHLQSNIVLCDVMYAKDEDVSSRPFNLRIGIVKSCYETNFQNLNSPLIKFTIRPFYSLKDFRILTDLFDPKPRRRFTRYPLAGISATSVDSGNCHSTPRMFLWTENIIEKPRVIVGVDIATRSVYGYALCGSATVVIAYLGKLSPDMFDFNGKVVEIEILEQDSLRIGFLNAKIIGPSTIDHPWSANKFLKYYPDRDPHMDIQKLKKMLESIASI